MSSHPASSLVRRLDRWTPFLLLLGTGAFYLVRLGAAGLYDPNEGRYAEIPREMLILHDWLTPRLNFIRYFEKPPLLYWLTAVAYQLFGISVFTARLVTGLSAIAGVGITYAIGRDLWGRRAGLASGLILGTSFGYYIFSRIVFTDMLFTLLLAATFWGLLRGLLCDTAQPTAVLGAYVAMALAFLAKGLIGLVFPLLTVGGFLFLTRDWRLLRRLALVRGGALFLAIAAPWHLLVGLRNTGFFHFYFVNEHWLRFLGTRPLNDNAPLPLSIFLVVVAVWMLPWSFFLPVALRSHWPRAQAAGREERGFLFVLLWAASIVGFFALTPSRMEWYSMPAFPALALCAGRFWATEMAPRPDQTPARGVTGTCGVLLALAAGLLLAVWFFPVLKDVSPHHRLFTAMDSYSREIQAGILSNAAVYTVPSYQELARLLRPYTLVFLAGIITATLACLMRRPGVTFALLVGAMLPMLSLVQNGIVLFEPHRSIVRLMGVLRQELRPGDQIVVEGPYENFGSASFYTGQRVRVLHGRFGNLLYGSRYPEAQGTFLEEEEFAVLWRGVGRVFLLSDAPDRIAKLRPILPRSVVLARSGKNWLFSNRERLGG